MNVVGRKIANRGMLDKTHYSICSTIDIRAALAVYGCQFKQGASYAIENISMTSQRQLRLIISLLFMLAAFGPAYGQEAPLNGFD